MPKVANSENQAAVSSPTQPRVWLVLSDKKGDNGQVHTIEEALGWRCELRHVRMLEQFVFGKPKVSPTLYHIDREKSDPLEPPWPDLVLTAGRRNEPVARWIRQQAGKSTRLVHVGRPWAKWVNARPKPLCAAYRPFGA